MAQGTMLVASHAENISVVHEELCNYGMDIFCVEDIEGAKVGLTLHSPAFLVLDVDLENSKYFLSQTSKYTLSLPPYIIAVGAFLDRKDQITMLELGADTCVTKPINAKEIFAIVRAVYRRESRFARLQRGKLLPRIEHKELSIDPVRKVVMIRGEQVSLTAKEFDVLYFLAYRAGIVVTKEEAN